MKFTKDDARKDLMSKIPNEGDTLQLSERSVNEMLENLIPLVANDETELSEFVDRVLPTFKTADGNVRHEVSVGINKYKEANPPQQKPIGQQTQNQNQNEDETTKELKAQLAALQARIDTADREKKETETRKDFISKVKEKGVKDSEWIKSYVSELTIGESFDVEARVDACVKLYNKTKASEGNNMTPDQSNGDNGDKKYVTGTLAAAAEIAKQRRTV